MKCEQLLAWARAFERYNGDRRYESLRAESAPDLVRLSDAMVATADMTFGEVADGAIFAVTRLDQEIQRASFSDAVLRHMRRAYDQAVLDAAEAICEACRAPEAAKEAVAAE